MAAGGLALMVVPQLVESLGWRAPYWTGLVLALAGALPVLAARPLVLPDPQSTRTPRRAVIGDRRLWPLAAVQLRPFGLRVVAGDWVVTLLSTTATGAASGLVGGLLLFAGIVTRPLGGFVVRSARHRAWRLVAVSLIVGSAVASFSPPLATLGRRARRSRRRRCRRFPVRRTSSTDAPQRALMLQLPPWDS